MPDGDPGPQCMLGSGIEVSGLQGSYIRVWGLRGFRVVIGDLGVWAHRVLVV